MTKPILLQTTITHAEDDWHVGRFSFLAKHLRSLVDEAGRPLYEIYSRDRTPGADGQDPVLAQLAPDQFDQVWVLGVDGGGGKGLSPVEVSGLRRYYEAGGALMLTRDHQDMGCALHGIGDVGAAHCWQTVAPEEDQSRHRPDDDNPTISWPNYHSGQNGGFQRIDRLMPDHPLLDGVRHLPAHPHEGVLREPPVGGTGVAVAGGRSQLSGRRFLIVAAFDHPANGDVPARRAVAQSTFHHFADYNLELDAGAPSFVTDSEAPLDEQSAEGAEATYRYWANLAAWLADRR